MAYTCFSLMPTDLVTLLFGIGFCMGGAAVSGEPGNRKLVRELLYNLYKKLDTHFLRCKGQKLAPSYLERVGNEARAFGEHPGPNTAVVWQTSHLC